ncbi:SCP2 sterol-binding domain-containing protein [Streptosporangium sp. NPDC001559]|uniref:SCP2 sterol-binding domain-containing protein n=1 Tax=Streptosporangium sp. NPDC001559 TaxID=3366187 RepID=UPI0036E23C9C
MQVEQIRRTIGRVSEESAAADAYIAVGVVTRFVIDNSLEVVLGRDGTVQTTEKSTPDLTIRLSSRDVTALVEGDLSVTRMITSGRVTAKGPIFQTIAVLRSLGSLKPEGK